ncbi:hypothetical protein ES707_18236 [subsurface metagenome]
MLHVLRQVNDHIVAEVVKAELTAGAVGNISLVSLTTGNGAKVRPSCVFGIKVRVINAGGHVLIRGLHGINTGNAYPKDMIDRPHPVGVSSGQVIINRNQVTALAGK